MLQNLFKGRHVSLVSPPPPTPQVPQTMKSAHKDEIPKLNKHSYILCYYAVLIMWVHTTLQLYRTQNAFGQGHVCTVDSFKYVVDNIVVRKG